MDRTERLALFNQYSGLPIHFWPRMQRRYGAMVMGREDFVQQGMTALWEACLRFDPTRGVKPITYLHRYVWGSLMTYCRHNGTGGVIKVPDSSLKNPDCPGKRPVYSLDSIMCEDSGKDYKGCCFAPEPAKTHADPELIALVLAQLGKRDRAIAEYRLMDGESLREMGIRLGVTKERIRQIEARLIVRLRWLLSGEKIPPKEAEPDGRLSSGEHCRRCGRALTVRQWAHGKCPKCRSDKRKLARLPPERAAC